MLRGFKIEVEYDADWTQESEGSPISLEMTISFWFHISSLLTGAELSHSQLVKPSAILGGFWEDFGGSYFPGFFEACRTIQGPMFCGASDVSTAASSLGLRHLKFISKKYSATGDF